MKTTEQNKQSKPCGKQSREQYRPGRVCPLREARPSVPLRLTISQRLCLMVASVLLMKSLLSYVNLFHILMLLPFQARPLKHAKYGFNYTNSLISVSFSTLRHVYCSSALLCFSAQLQNTASGEFFLAIFPFSRVLMRYFFLRYDKFQRQLGRST